MLATNLKFALRSLGKYKMYSLVNLLGLTLGLTATLVIGLYLINELSFDKYHRNADRIYQLVAEHQVPGQGVVKNASLPPPMATVLRNNIPGIDNAFRLIILGRADLTYEENGYYELVNAVDPQIFEMLDYEFIKGDPETALDDPSAIILTESTAKKYFGNEDPIGKVLTGNRGQNRVTAVIADPPPNTHLPFSAIFPFPPYISSFIADMENNWNADNFVTYLQLNPNTEVSAIESAITDYVHNRTPLANAQDYSFSLLALPDIHFQSGDIQGQVNNSPGDVSVVLTLAAIAVFLILIACINYTNLATARSINRAHEISLRKLLGANRTALVLQFLAEAIILTLLAFIASLSIAQMILPAVNGFIGKTLHLGTLLQPAYLLATVALVLLIGFAAGAYPALVLSTQRISSGLRDSLQATRRANALRKLLVVTQFTLSVVLVFCTLSVFDQMAYIRNKPLGFDRENLIAIDINSGRVRIGAQAIKDEILQYPEVLSVSTGSRLPGDWKPGTQVAGREPGQDLNDSKSADLFVVDENYLKTFAINLAAGRNFIPSDTQGSILVNQTLVRQMGWEQPIGQHLLINSNVNPTTGDVALDATVVGVVEDFHFQSLHQVIGPVVMQNGQQGIQTLLPHDYFGVRVTGNDLTGTIEHLRQVMLLHDPVTPLEYNFVDSQMEDNFYSSDRITAGLFTLSAGLAIFIACMGLFGLTAFTTEQRSKEIGIRKVLGATIANIVQLLSADFMRLVLVAIIIALPAGYYLMNLWLQDFAYTQGIGVDVYLVSTLLAITVSLGTVSMQSVKAAMRNPVESISYE